MKSIVKIIVSFLFAASVQLNAAPSAPLPIPDPSLHRDFLLEPWEPGKPVLIAFKDPFCPYCITALKKRKQLSKYNVFLFWSAILGDNSVARVNDFFNCQSPTDTEVLEASIKQVKPACKGPFKEELFELNNRMVTSYKLNTVPQYWFGGRQVARSRLNLDRNIVDADSIAKSSPIKMNWSRYQHSAVNQSLANRFNIGIVLPAGYSLSRQELKMLVENSRYNWYLFGDGVNEKNYAQFWCAHHTEQCADNKLKSYKNNSEEFKLLTGLYNIDKPKVIFEGKELIKSEKNYLIPEKILVMLAAKLKKNISTMD